MELDNIEKQAIAKFLKKPFEELQNIFLGDSGDYSKSTVIRIISSLYDIEVEPTDVWGAKNPDTNANMVIVALPNGGKHTFAIGPNASLLRTTIPMSSPFSS